MFAVGQQVFPKWSQRLPAFTVTRVGAVTVTIVDDGGNREIMHKDDIVARDPAAHYESPRYEALG
jgi:hypothetical protein